MILIFKNGCKYDGEVDDENRFHGYGKYYDSNGMLVNDGSYKHGELDGFAKNYYRSRLMFEGSFCNGKRHGIGKYYDPLNDSILVYDGEYYNGVRHGNGKLYYAIGQLEFEGEFVNGEPNENNGQYYTETGEQ